MSAYSKKGIAVWILGFLTFLAFLNAFNAVLMWTLGGSEFEFEPYLISEYTGRIQVTLYFWISVATAFIFLGCTAVMAFRKPPLDPDLIEALEMINNHLAANKKALEEGLEANTKSIKTIKTDLMERMETQKRVNEKSFETLSASLQSTRKETLDALEKQRKGLQEFSQELFSAIETSISGVRGEVLGALAKQEEVIRRVGRSSRKSIKTIEKAIGDLGR